VSRGQPLAACSPLVAFCWVWLVLLFLRAAMLALFPKAALGAIGDLRRHCAIDITRVPAGCDASARSEFGLALITLFGVAGHGDDPCRGRARRWRSPWSICSPAWYAPMTREIFFF